MSKPAVRIPLYFYILAGRVKPTDEHARYLQQKEWYAGPFDGQAIQMPNTVDWSRSEVDLSPLIPWLGNPDSMWPRKLAKLFQAEWPDLRGQLEVIKLEVEIIGEGYKWGDLVPIRAIVRK